MAETTKRNNDPKPRNEPTEVKEIPRSGGGKSTTGGSTGGQNQMGNRGATGGAGPTSGSNQMGTSSGGGTPKSSSEKIGSAATPRVGTTTGSSQSTSSNTETRGAPRNEGDESGMPKRSGPGREKR